VLDHVHAPAEHRRLAGAGVDRPQIDLEEHTARLGEPSGWVCQG
jgi:hypothetical protein